jgi:hypothetical protein
MLDALQSDRISRMLRQRHADPNLPPALQVHRNTVWLSWLQAMRAQFPSVQCFNATDFDAWSRDYLCAQPTRHAVLLDIGADFASWLDARHAPTAAELARLDWAWSRAHTAADAASLNAQDLTQLWSEPLQQLCLHPSVQLLSVQRAEALAHWLQLRFAWAAPHQAQHLVIHRVDDRVHATCPEAAHWVFLCAARERQTVQDAITAAAAAQAEVDWAAWGQCILDQQWLCPSQKPVTSSEESHHVD